MRVAMFLLRSCILVAALSALASCHVVPSFPGPSPCPLVFQYEPNPEAAMGWRGVVRVLAPPRFTSLHLQVTLAASEFLPPDPPPGTLTLRGGVPAARGLVRAAQQGRRNVVEFLADFSCGVSAPPALLNVTVNGRLFCSASREPEDTRSTISLVSDLETGLEWASTGDDEFSIVPEGSKVATISSTVRPGAGPEPPLCPVGAAPSATPAPAATAPAAPAPAAPAPRPGPGPHPSMFMPAGNMYIPHTPGAQHNKYIMPHADRPPQSSPPPEEYKPPKESYKPPPDMYKPPPEAYKPTPEAYKPPSEAYTPPAEAYKPPTAAYKPPAEAYKPPTAAYKPPAEAYKPRPEEYAPPPTNPLPTTDHPRPLLQTSVTDSRPPSQGPLLNEDCGRAWGAVPNLLVTRGSAAVRGRWPWLVALFKKLGRRDQLGLNFECGASLVSRKHVVTAAHCVEVRGRRGKPAAPADLVVFLGKHDLSSYTEPGQQTAEVDAVKIHPDYATGSTVYDNDIALLVLADVVEPTKSIRPVCLWDAVQGGTEVSGVEGMIGAVPGWGKDDTGAISNEVRVANMPIVSQETCLRSNIFYHKFTSNKTFCAGFKNGTSVCNGDSGGGLFIKDPDGRWRIRGIVSVSMYSVNEQTCDSYNYAVFTDIAKFLPWLQDQMYSTWTS